MTIDLDLALHLATIIAAGGVSWGVVKTKMGTFDRRHDQHDKATQDLSKRILTVEHTVADRVARIETKVDLLLAAWVGNLKRDRENHD